MNIAPILLAAVLAVRVVDGDTLAVGSEKIRLVGVDAPELRGAHCPAELALARLAAARLEALTAGGAPKIERRGVDRYGRTLAVVRAAGVDVGARLIEEGYARPWPAHRHWCEN